MYQGFGRNYSRKIFELDEFAGFGEAVNSYKDAGVLVGRRSDKVYSPVRP